MVDVIANEQCRAEIKRKLDTVGNDEAALHGRATGRVVLIKRISIATITAVGDPRGQIGQTRIQILILTGIRILVVAIVIPMIAPARRSGVRDPMLLTMPREITGAHAMYTAPKN